jgi:hypothetical protein
VKEIARACDPGALVFFFGPPGSGKTIAVDAFAQERAGHVHRLALPLRDDELADSLGHSAPGDLVVADGLDCLDPAAQETLIAELTRLPAGVQAVVTSRLAPPPAAARHRLAESVRVIDPRILALDRGEAEELGWAYGIDATAAAGLLEDSGGWIAGFILLARARLSGVDRDALDAYVAAEVVPALSQPLRFALAATAGLDRVSERLLVELADDRSVASELMRVPLPGASTPRDLRLAPCVRRLLAPMIERAAAREACTRAASNLRAAGASADATDALIAAGHLVAAEAPAAEAASQGADDERVLEWLYMLDPGAARRRAPLRDAELRALHRGGEHAAVVRTARTMRASGELEALLARDEPAAAWALAALIRRGHASDLLTLLGEAQGLTWAPTAWALEVLCGPDPAPAPLDVGAVATLPTASVVAEALLWRGRPADAMALLELAEGRDPAVALDRAGQLLAVGDVAAAQELSTADDLGSVGLERLAALRCELAVAAGDPDQALHLLPPARGALERAGDALAARIDLAIVEAHALWLRGEPRRALTTLEAARSWARSRGLRAAVEWIDVWRAGTMVAAGSTAAARRLLKRSLAGMTRAGRRFGRPFGSLVLAEACWLEGDEAGHDKAADDAVRYALHSGGRLMLRAADRLLPGPLARRDRDHADAGGHRRVLERAIAAADIRRSAPAPFMHVWTLGRAGLALLPGEQPVQATRRIVDLLAYLVARGGAAPVDEVVEDLFPTPTGIAVMKRAVRAANGVLPPVAKLSLTDAWLRIDPPGALVSDDEELMGLAGAAALAQGAQGAHLRSAVLLIASAGPFMPHLDSDWARARRNDVATAASDCVAGGAMWPREDPADDPGRSQLDVTRRLLARTALAKGVPAERPISYERPGGRSRAPAARTR